jgi:hypothetical protein
LQYLFEGWFAFVVKRTRFLICGLVGRAGLGHAATATRWQLEQRRLAIIFRSGGVVLGGLFETAGDYFAVIRRVTIVPAPF